MLIGEKIRELRAEKDMLQRELAEKIHIAPNTLSQFESGKANPSYEVLISIADFFEVSTDWLLDRADDFGNVTVTSHSSSPALPADEQRLLTGYRQLTNPLKKMIQETLDTFLESDLNQPKRKQNCL